MFQVSIRYRLRPGQTFVKLQYPSTFFQRSPAVLEPQETVQIFTQRAREALNDQRETARHALLHQQGKFLAATYQFQAPARQNLVSAVARNYEAHNLDVQMQVRQFVKEADVRFSRRQMEVLSRFSQEANQARGSARNFGNGSNIRSVEVRWAIARRTYRTELSSTTRGTRVATTCWTTAFDRFGSGNTAISNCSIGCWTRNGSTSTKRGRTLVRSTTSN